MSTEFINDQWRLPNAWNGTESNVNKQSNYSMDFDGSSQKIDLGNTDAVKLGAGDFTFSAWINPDSWGSSFEAIYANAGTNGVFIGKDDAGNFVLRIYYVSNIITYSTLPTVGAWTHICVTRDNGQCSLFYNGSSVATATSTHNFNASANVFVGSDNGSGDFNGKIDAVAIYNYALSSSQITTLYGSSSTGIGNPMSLSPKPVASYNLGDKSAFNSANYLVPNIAAQEDDGDIAVSYSPYALDFDSASSDYIDCGNDSSFDITSALTLSAWVKLSSVTTDQFYISKRGGSSANAYQISSFSNKAAGMSIWIGGSRKDLLGTTNHAQDTWYHVVGTYDGLNMRIYLNGVEENSVAQTGVIDTTTTKLILGAYDGVGYSFDGSISNCSIWNTALTSTQVSEIYNEGVPSNLNNHSAYSNLVSWWQLGSNSSFNTNWTVLDEKGSNNGTSVNMTEDAIVDGVGSYANGVSSGMSDNIVGNAPYSNANSLSYNMDVLDRTEDTPS